MNVHIGQRLAGVGLFVAVVVVMGCRGNDHVEKGATPAVPSETPATVSVTRTPAATVIPTVPSSAATTEGCPIDDSAMCEFAVQLQDALNANRIGFITQRLMPQERPCRDVIYASGEDLGCATPVGRSVPVVMLLRLQSDCCSTRMENFEPQLIGWINEHANGQSWRLYAAVPKADLWNGGAEILLVRGNGDGAPTIVVGTLRQEDAISIPGVVIGPRGGLFIGPDEEFLPWP